MAPSTNKLYILHGEQTCPCDIQFFLTTTKNNQHGKCVGIQSELITLSLRFYNLINSYATGTIKYMFVNICNNTNWMK
jgi:hypothetical protein